MFLIFIDQSEKCGVLLMPSPHWSMIVESPSVLQSCSTLFRLDGEQQLKTTPDFLIDFGLDFDWATDPTASLQPKLKVFNIYSFFSMLSYCLAPSKLS